MDPEEFISDEESYEEEEEDEDARSLNSFSSDEGDFDDEEEEEDEDDQEDEDSEDENPGEYDSEEYDSEGEISGNSSIVYSVPVSVNSVKIPPPTILKAQTLKAATLKAPPVTKIKSPPIPGSLKGTVVLPKITAPARIVSPVPDKKITTLSAPIISPDELESKLMGINIRGVTPILNTQLTPEQQPNLEDFCVKENTESSEEFEARKIITEKLTRIPIYPMNMISAVTLGHIIMKKARLGLVYDSRLELTVNHLLTAIKNVA